MSTWPVPLNELSREQRDAVELNTKEHRVIGGAPGSGKTQILLHRARHLLDESGVAPSRCRIFVFTNVLRDYIQTALDLLNLPDSCVSTFDAWCCEYYERHISRSLPWNKEEKRRDYPRIRQEVWNRVRAMREGERPFEFALVDEAQDLSSVSIDIIKAIARHVTVCIDHKQQIYEDGTGEVDILQRLGLKRSNFTLLSAFRCSPYVLNLAANCIADAEQRQALIRQNRVPMPKADGEKETPLLYIAENIDDEHARVIEAVKTRQGKGERIAILLQNNTKVFSWAGKLAAAGLEVEIRQERWRKDSQFPPLDFSSDLPKVLTYYSAKGLTFDSVFLPRLVPGSFRPSAIPQTNLLFVGATRATKWVFLSTQRGKELPIFSSLRRLSPEGLTIQTRQDRFRWGSPATKPAVQTSLFETEQEDIGDLL